MIRTTMALGLASSFNLSIGIQQASNRRVNLTNLFSPKPSPTLTLNLPRRSIAALARRGPRTTSVTAKRKKQKLKRDVNKEADGSSDDGGDPFEALFAMLEEDLKGIDEALLGIDDDDDGEDFSPEELEKLEKELDAAIGESEELMRLVSMGDDDGNVTEMGVGGEDEDEEGFEVELEDWQIKKLAAALKVGRRKTNIRSLAAELDLDKEIVIELLSNPPEDILEMSGKSSNQKSPVVLEAEYEVLGDVPEKASEVKAKAEATGFGSQKRRTPPKSRKNVQQ